MTPYAGAERPGGWLYDLFAVVNHSGNLGGGHYTAFVLRQGQWYLFNDSQVQTVRESQVQSSSAYILFYRLRGADDDSSSSKL